MLSSSRYPGSKSDNKLYFAFVCFFQNRIHLEGEFVDLLHSIFVGVVEELVPVVGIVLLVSFRQVYLVDYGSLQIQLQLLELLVELPPCLVFNVSVILVALHHLPLGPANNLLEHLLQQHLLVLFLELGRTALYFRRLRSLLGDLFVGLISVEEMQQFREVFNIDGLEESVVIVLQFFLPLLYESFIGGPEQFPGGEDW